MMRWLIASEIDFAIDLLLEDSNPNRHLAKAVLGYPNSETSQLVRNFLKEPALTRFEVRGSLFLQQTVVSQLFALVVFVSDGLLKIKEEEEELAFSPPEANSIRFLKIAISLPMEVQMLLCHRTCESTRSVILSKDSELAFRSLTRKVA